MLVVSFYVSDYEGTFSHVIGLATDEVHAEEIKAAYKRLLLAERNNGLTFCQRCGFGKPLHDPEGEELKKLKAFGKEHGLKPRIDQLLNCPFEPPPPLTELRENEDFSVEPFEPDVLPTEIG